ncbi:MAG: ATP-binding protein [Magnetococcus sp. DMHC-6]
MIIEKAIINNAFLSMDHEMDETIHRAEMFHNQAKNYLLLALENPVFERFFSLLETQSGNHYDEKGVLQFTQAQESLKKQMEEWSLMLQNRLPIEEICLFDQSGQEFTRITMGHLAQNSVLSSTETVNPFFESTFQLTKGEVYISKPYISPDVKKWVFSYTSPIFSADGRARGALHFEIPVVLFQDMLFGQKGKHSLEKGSHRLFVLDHVGRLIVDEANPSNFKLNPEDEILMDKEILQKKDIGSYQQWHDKYFPSLHTISDQPEFLAAVEKSKGAAVSGRATFKHLGETYYMVYGKLPTSNWTLFLLKPYHALLEGEHSLGMIQSTILCVVLSILVVVSGIIVWLVKKIISIPLGRTQLGIAKIASNLDLTGDLPVEGYDELSQLAIGFNIMSQRLRDSYTHLEQEIDKRRQAEMLLQEQANNLEKMVDMRTKQLVHADRLATLGTFSATMAHEINNPNCFILSNVDFLEQFFQLAIPVLEKYADEDSSGRLKRFVGQIVVILKEIREGSNRITKIVDSLKAYSKGGGSADRIDCRLQDPLQDALNLMQHQLKKGIQVNVSLDINAMLYCDRQQISQVFINLIQNAMDAMNDSGQAIKILTLTALEKDGYHWIRLRDNGPGIPKEVQERIFDPFFTTKGKTKGTGLGLAVVQGIIEDHKGQISLYSPPEGMEQGCEFLILLPTMKFFKTNWLNALESKKTI